MLSEEHPNYDQEECNEIEEEEDICLDQNLQLFTEI